MTELITVSNEAGPNEQMPSPAEPKIDLHRPFRWKLKAATWYPTRSVTRTLATGDLEVTHYGRWAWLWESVAS